MIYLTSYVPTDTLGRVALVFVVFLSISCCNLGEIHGFQGKDEEITKQIKLHEIRKKNQQKKPSSTAARRIHALANDLLPSARGLQSPTGRDNVPPVRINRRDNPAPVWQMHRLPDRSIQTMGSPLHARSLITRGKRVHHTYVLTGKSSRREDASRLRLSTLHETASKTLRSKKDSILSMRRIRRRM